jgi:transcriptional regulator with XRE-family HTH domain
MNLEQFGKSLRELRQKRGLTQDDVVQASRSYGDARSLRKVESGELRPRRDAVINLLKKGMDEHDVAVIDSFLDMAGYEPLREKERISLGVAPHSPVRQNSEVNRPTNSAAPALLISSRMLIAWKVAMLTCLVAGIGLSIVVRNVFLIATAFLYAALYAVSVFLESAYEFKGAVTVLAALVSFSAVWATSLSALWIETSIRKAPGLWIAIAIFMLAAAGQWFLSRSALSASANVPTRFQSLTGRTAHLKNTGYYLIFVFSFWAIPVHCIASNGGLHSSVFCPPPAALWILLLLYFAASLPMGHTLLSRLRADATLDLYVTLFFARAILWLFLSVVCLLWYSSALTR